MEVLWGNVGKPNNFAKLGRQRGIYTRTKTFVSLQFHFSHGWAFLFTRRWPVCACPTGIWFKLEPRPNTAYFLDRHGFSGASAKPQNRRGRHLLSSKHIFPQRPSILPPNRTIFIHTRWAIAVLNKPLSNHRPNHFHRYKVGLLM